MRIAVTGANGFIGSHLVNYLLENTDHEIVALSRSELISSHPRLITKSCDLYSLLQIETALEDCDVAIYLVHSMSPSSRLSQGDFQDFDFLLADNFSKAAEKNMLKQIIYVSGLVSENDNPSAHLMSRLEVETTLMRHKVPVTTFRCGIVMGPSGSSFIMVKKLVKRLFLIVLPKWSLTKTQVISIRDLIDCIHFSIENPEKSIGSYDLANAKALSYAQFIKRVSVVMKTNNKFIRFPWIPIWISKYWICFITGYSKALVYPLVESLSHSMVAKPDRLWPHKKSTDFEKINDTIEWSLNPLNKAVLPVDRYTPYTPSDTDLVQSVQRLPVPPGWSMKKVANAYMIWLPRFFKPFLKITRHNDDLHFMSFLSSKPLLVLRFSKERTSESRELFYIIGGLLSKPHAHARLVFRESPNHLFFIAAIHSFHPSLPWYLYRYTQALIHKWVMKKFGQYLRKQIKFIS